MLDATIDDMNALDAIACGIERRADLGEHAAGQGAIGDHVIDLFRRHAGDQPARLVEDARRVGQQDQLLGLENFGDLAGHDIGVDVVGFATFADTDRRYHRDEAAGLQVPDQ